MQTTDKPIYLEATFIRELKNRFLCEVEFNGESVVCYVPSSCHLSNFLKLEGKKVLLVPTLTKSSRTKYALFAVPYKRNYILLNTSMANRAIERNIHSRRFAYLGKRNRATKEHYVNGYKSDLFIEDTNTIIEIKSILSIEKNASFPTVYSERSLKQLEKIRELLEEGYKVCYIIVSLSPYVEAIEINVDTPFYTELVKCINKGMRLSAYSCKLADGTIEIKREIQIRMNSIIEK